MRFVLNCEIAVFVSEELVQKSLNASSNKTLFGPW